MGGAEPLARSLNVPPTSVTFWLTGSSPVPGHVFLNIVDLLLDRAMTDLQAPGKSKAEAPARTSGRDTQ